MISETDASQTNSVCSSDDEIATFVSSLFEAQERDDEDDGGVFYFETDYAPLKANVDYMKLIRALAILDVQRMKVCRDIDKLEELKAKVREDPDAVKREILSGEAPFLTRCTIEKVPEIDWTKYKMLDFDGKLAPMTRRMAKQPPLHQGGGSSETRAQQDQHQPRDGKIRVRGRVYTENKPQTFNQLWTVEEQMRLEALLVEFPPEPVESRRWKKIADALGNRTTKQVCSRVQKYFKKLQKAGIAIPGRIPQKSSSRIMPNRINKRHKHLLYRPTTFFPGEAMRSICGSDDNSGGDEEGDGEEVAGAVGEEAATNQTASLNLNDGYLAHWVDILETIRKEKEATDMDSVRHYGFRCHHCGEDPIVGTRWICSTCPPPSVSFCCDCLALLPEGVGGRDEDEAEGARTSSSQLSSSSSASSSSESESSRGGVGHQSRRRRRQPSHPLSHIFTPCRVFSNPQYKPQLLGTANYLDPNFS